MGAECRWEVTCPGPASGAAGAQAVSRASRQAAGSLPNTQAGPCKLPWWSCFVSFQAMAPVKAHGPSEGALVTASHRALADSRSCKESGAGLPVAAWSHSVPVKRKEG